MAADPLDEMNEALDDSMADILEDASDDLLDDPVNDTTGDADGLSANDLQAAVRDSGTTDKGSAKDKINRKLKDLAVKIFGSKKLIILTAAAIVLILLAGVGGLVFLFSSGEDSYETSGVPVKKDSAHIIEEIAFEDIVELEPFERIPLKSSSTMKLITMNIALELVDKNQRKYIYPAEEQIRQMVLDQMAKMTWLELRMPEGKIMLKYNLLHQINSLFPKAMVRNVYFTYFVMQ